MDPLWQNVSKITLDLPWRPAHAGWQQEIGEGEERIGETCDIDKQGLNEE